MTVTHGAPERLCLLQLHTMVVSPHGRELVFVLGCYLMQTDDGTNILVDSGLPAGYQQPGAPPPDHSRDVLECLADLNLHPDDIDILVCTHFDVDHEDIMTPFRAQSSSSSAPTMSKRGVAIHAMPPRGRNGTSQPSGTDWLTGTLSCSPVSC